MTPQEFQANQSGKLKEFFDSPLGKEFLGVLNSLRPAYEFPIHEHLMMANRESIRGYEMCMRNMIALTMAPKILEQPKANYGIDDIKPKDK